MIHSYTCLKCKKSQGYLAEKPLDRTPELCNSCRSEKEAEELSKLTEFRIRVQYIARGKTIISVFAKDKAEALEKVRSDFFDDPINEDDLRNQDIEIPEQEFTFEDCE